MKTIMRGALVACAAALGLHAWADTHDYSVTNQAYTHNQANYTSKALTLTLPEIPGAATGTEIAISEIIMGTAGDSNGGKYPRYIEINDVKSAQGTTPARIDAINDNGTKFTFEGLKLAIGTAYSVTCYDGDGETAITTIRYRVAARTSTSIAPFVIAGANDWAPLCLISGTFEAVLPVYNATVTAEGITWDPELPETITSGSTLNITGTGAVGTLSVPAGVTANLSGDLSVTLTNNGEVNILSGVCEVSKNGDESIKGTVNIAKNATFKSLSGDAVGYRGQTTINVYGTLDMGTTRWTVGSTSTINCYGGCTVTADDTNTRAIDFLRSGTIITVNKVEGEATTVSLPSISPRNTDGSTIEIANGMTLTIVKPIAKSDTTDGLVKIAGAGKLAGTISLKDGIALDLGSTNGQIAKFVSESGVNTLKWVGNGNAHICDNDSAESPFVTVNSGATLKIYGHDFSGWNGGLTEHGWILNNGNLVFTNGDGSRFWREHIIFGDGATMSIDHGNRALLMYGGAGTADACQFMLPSGTATIAAGAEGAKAVLYFGNDGQGGWGDDDAAKKATGFSIGAGAALTVSAPIQGNQAISKYGAGTLVFSNTTSTYSGSVTLNAGTIKSATTLTVSAPEGYTLNTDTESEEGVTIYTLIRDAGTVYAKNKEFTQFVLEDGTVADLVEGDTIVCDAHMEGNVWGGGVNPTNFAAYQIVVAREMDFGAGSGIPANGKVTINYNDGVKGVYLYGNIGAGATIDGTGLLYLGHTASACTIGDGATISCNVAFQNGQKIATINGAVTISGTITIDNGLIKLSDDASLTTAELAEGSVVAVDTTKTVQYAEGKYTVVSASPTVPKAIEGGSEAQQSEYAEWATANGVSGSTKSELAAAFAVGATGTDEATVLADAQDELVAILATIDLTAITTEAFTLEDYPNATFKFVPASLGAGVTTTASLFRLTVSFKPANSQSEE